MTAPSLPVRPGTRRFTLRVIFASLCGLLMLNSTLLASAPTRAAEPAEEYISALKDKAVSVLQNKSLDQKDRYDAFRTLIIGNTDLDRIAAFALGRYANDMRASGRYDEYLSLFRDYVVRIYAARLGQYSGEKLNVLKSMPRGTREVIVYSQLEPSVAGSDPVPVNWRLTREGDSFKIVDVQIVGAWMAIEQQSQFTSIISSNNRNPVTLIDYLKKQLEAPLPPPHARPQPTN